MGDEKMRHFSVGIFFTIAVMMAAVTTPVRAEETPVDGGQIVACEETNAGSIPLRLRRSESFFGMHMDFHCGMTDQNVGANTTPENRICGSNMMGAAAMALSGLGEKADTARPRHAAQNMVRNVVR